MAKFSVQRAAAAFASVVMAGSAAWCAETGKVTQVLGTTASPTVGRAQAASMAKVKVAALAATGTYASAQYATGSVALRNRAGGLLSISGVVAPIKAAFLYWAVIDADTPLPTERTITLTPTAGEPLRLRGVQVGVGPSPCWGGTSIYVYKAAIPPRAIGGNGTYRVTLSEGSYGSASGADPWIESPTFPLWDGATLVVIGKGTSRVSVFDQGLSGNTFTGSISYTLPLSAAAGSSVLFGNIAADGQIGSSRLASAGTPGKTTTINGVTVAGPGSIAGDSDYDGRVGTPLPQLWDDTGRDISSAAAGASSLRIDIGNTGDCLTPVANIVQY